MQIGRIVFCAFLFSSFAFAQDASKLVTDAPPPVCDQQRALSLIREQLADAKASDKVEARIRLHLTAADLLWPHRRDLAREWFTSAWHESRDFFKQPGVPKRKSATFRGKAKIYAMSSCARLLAVIGLGGKPC